MKNKTRIQDKFVFKSSFLLELFFVLLLLLILILLLLLLEELEELTRCVVINAMLQVKEFLDAVFLVFTVLVVGLFLGSSHTLNAFLKVVLEAVARGLGSSLSQSRKGILGLVVVLIVVVVVLFFFFVNFFFFDVL